jgi:hypothetical protein
MTLEIKKIGEFILNHNYLGLESYLQKQSSDLNTLITAEIFILAITEFINSDARNITNSYNVISSLRKHFFDENRHTKYSLSTEHEEITALFNMCDKVFNHRKYKLEDVKAVSGIAGINVYDLENKFALYEERQQRRLIYKLTDNVIEKQFVYPIKYPNNTGFIRKLLGLAPKRPSADIIKDFNDKLPTIIDDIRKELYEEGKFFDKKKQFLLSESETSEIIHERISLKAVKQLGIDQTSVDAVFKKYNTQKLIAKLQSFSKVQDEDDISKESLDEFLLLLTNMIPNHLMNLKETRTSFIGLLSPNSKLFNALDNHLKSIQEKITQQSALPWKIEQVENMLLYAIELNDKLNRIEEKEIYKSLKDSNQQQLLDLQKKLNKKLYDDHKNHKLPKAKLTDFEKRAISKMALSNDQHTEEDKKLIATFVEYVSGNKEFNTRLGKIIKSDNDFVKQHKKEIGLLHKYTYKSSELDGIIKSLDKIELMLTKLEQNPQQKFLRTEKITLQELGKINKYIDGDIISVLKKASYNTPQIQKLINTHKRAENIINRLDEKIKSQINYEEGDLVMDVADRYHKLKLHSNNSFFKWLENLIQDWITPYSHAAVGMKLEDTKGVVEIWDKYKISEVDAQNSLISETFRVYPHALLQNIEIEKKLIEALEINKEGLKSKLHEMYRNCSADIVKDIDLSVELKNERGKRRQAGLADFQVGGHKTSTSVRSWAQKVIDEKVNSGIKISTGENIICSEFAAKITALTIVALEKELLKVLQKKDPNFALKDGEALLKMPFNEYEDLNKIHPARLIKELGKHGAIEKIENSKAIDNMILSR